MQHFPRRILHQVEHPFEAFRAAVIGIGHFVLIGASAGLLNLALGLRTVRWFGRAWLLGSVIIVIFCTLEEISQHWLPARSFDLLDLAGDYAGIFCFGWLAKRIARWRGQV